AVRKRQGRAVAQMPHRLEAGVPGVGRIGLVRIDRAISIHQVKDRIGCTGYRWDLYPGNQIPGRAIVFLHFPLEPDSPSGVGIKPDVEPIRIGYVTTVSDRLERRISEAY